MFQGLSNATYRLIARAVAQAFGSFECVRTVFLRRSVAMGDVAFGRSDIDFTIVLEQPLASEADAETIVALNRGRRVLKGLVPIVGECEVGTADELLRSYRGDPYRASIERRTAITLYGERLEIPQLPVTTTDALPWLVFWFGHYMPVALRRGNHRNLRKFAIEMWNAAQTATGAIEEPYSSRAAALAAWRQADGGSVVDNLGESVEETFLVCCRLVGSVYRSLPPERQTVNSSFSGRLKIPGRLLIPESGPPPTREERLKGGFLGTPRILDLYVSHVDPNLYDELPVEVRNLGICRPGREEYLRFCRSRACDPRLLRLPGFIADRESAAYSIGLIEAGHEIARRLRAGEKVSKVSSRRNDLRKQPPSIQKYYRSHYPQLYTLAAEAWQDLDSMENAARRP